MNKQALNIFTEVEKIISPVYLVGGCIRDLLLDKEPQDYDFSTPLLPEEIEQKIKQAGKRAYLTGKKFGTIGVKINGLFIEITTFRTESYLENSRKPNVEFVDNITYDLSRRDFRINAIAWRNGKYIDPFCGKLDILEKKIRSVGEPKARIKEDPLRMLRCGRFASQLNFAIDDFLQSTIQKYNYKILSISKERWCKELDKILLSNNPSIGLNFLMNTRLINFMIPELSLQLNYEQNSPYHCYDLWNHTLQVVKATPIDINLRWAALLHDIAKPFVRTNKNDKSNYIHHDYLGAEIVEKTARYLKWSNEQREKIKLIVLTHLNEDNPLKIFDDKAKIKEDFCQ